MRSLTTTSVVAVVVLVIHVTPHRCLSLSRTFPQLLSSDYYYQEYNFTDEESGPKNFSLGEETTTTAAGGDGDDVVVGGQKSWPFYNDQGNSNGSSSAISGCFQQGGLTGCLKMAVLLLFPTTTLQQTAGIEEDSVEGQLQQVNGEIFIFYLTGPIQLRNHYDTVIKINTTPISPSDSC